MQFARMISANTSLPNSLDVLPVAPIPILKLHGLTAL
jgi:hypothetical protein